MAVVLGRGKIATIFRSGTNFQPKTWRRSHVSDTYLRLIPSQPTYVPSAEAARAAEEQLRRILPLAHRVCSHTLPEVRFVDCGVNLERVLCVLCGQDLLVNDVWQRLMDNAYQGRFRELVVVLPCCGERLSLNDLGYGSPCGFATYVLEALNPGQDLTDEQLAVLGRLLGCPMRSIRRHL